MTVECFRCTVVTIERVAALPRLNPIKRHELLGLDAPGELVCRKVSVPLP
ncbi:MAG: hypothetical protein QOK02_4208 [Mycobacterium sp.]|jgi:hypothetical protein|nr:hypothetical protein [Mycobacterium sp.]